MKNLLAAFAASLVLVGGTFAVATAPASAAGRDDGAHHARHAQRDDGARAKSDDGPHRARHTQRDDGARGKRDDGPHRARHTQRDDGPRHR
jgi:hypothetical protein